MTCHKCVDLTVKQKGKIQTFYRIHKMGFHSVGVITQVRMCRRSVEWSLKPNDPLKSKQKAHQLMISADSHWLRLIVVFLCWLSNSSPRGLQENVQCAQTASSGGSIHLGDREPWSYPSTIPTPTPTTPSASITSPSGFTLGRPPPCGATTAPDGLGWTSPGKDSPPRCMMKVWVCGRHYTDS